MISSAFITKIDDKNHSLGVILLFSSFSKESRILNKFVNIGLSNFMSIKYNCSVWLLRVTET
jgi:hypothetical protein